MSCLPVSSSSSSSKLFRSSEHLKHDLVSHPVTRLLLSLDGKHCDLSITKRHHGTKLDSFLVSSFLSYLTVLLFWNSLISTTVVLFAFCGEKIMWRIDTVDARKSNSTIFCLAGPCMNLERERKLSFQIGYNWHVSLTVFYWDIIMNLSCTCLDGCIACLVWFSNTKTGWLFQKQCQISSKVSTRPNVCGHLDTPHRVYVRVEPVIPKLWAVLNTSEVQHWCWVISCGSESVLQFIPKVLDEVEVRGLCRPVKFFHTKVGK